MLEAHLATPLPASFSPAARSSPHAARLGAMVCMPSCTWPMFSKMPPTTHMIQPDMLLMRITSPVARAMAPTEISDWLHSHRARPVVPAISRPLMTRDGHVHGGHHAPGVLGLEGLVADGFAGVVLFLAGVGEQLQGGDVGVAVDDPAHQLRARIRGHHRAVLDLGNEVGEGADVGERPQHQTSSGIIRRQSASANSTRALTV